MHKRVTDHSLTGRYTLAWKSQYFSNMTLREKVRKTICFFLNLRFKTKTSWFNNQTWDMETKNSVKCLNIWIHCLQKWIYGFRKLLRRKDEVSKLESANFWFKNKELKNVLLNESSLQSFFRFTNEISSLNEQLDKAFYWKTKLLLQNCN